MDGYRRVFSLRKSSFKWLTLDGVHLSNAASTIYQSPCCGMGAIRAQGLVAQTPNVAGAVADRHTVAENGKTVQLHWKPYGVL